MYALIHNSQLLWGPIQWNYRMFNSELEEELELDYRVGPDDWRSVPININEETHILPAKQIIPEHDSRFQSVGAFTWSKEYTDLTKATSPDPESLPDEVAITEIVCNDFGQILATIPNLKVSPGFKLDLRNLSFDTPSGTVTIDDGEYLINNVEDDVYTFEGFEVDHEFTYSGGAYVVNKCYLSAAVFTYPILEKSLEQVKDEYKVGVKPERQRRENLGITLSINNQDVTVSTSRENRMMLVTKLMGNDGPYNFKFDNNIWVEITKSDLESIIQQIDTHVQEQYDWELNKLAEIDACETKETVYDVEIVPPPVEPDNFILY